MSICCTILLCAHAQKSYKDSMLAYQKDYTELHEVVKGKDKEKFHFYRPDVHYRVRAKFERVENGNWFQIPTSGNMKKTYRVYGRLHLKSAIQPCN